MYNRLNFFWHLKEKKINLFIYLFRTQIENTYTHSNVALYKMYISHKSDICGMHDTWHKWHKKNNLFLTTIIQLQIFSLKYKLI